MKAKHARMILGTFPKRKLLNLKLWKCFLKWRNCTTFLGLCLDLRKTWADARWQMDKFHNPPFLLLAPWLLWFTVGHLNRERIFHKTLKAEEKLQKVLLARDVKGGNCIDLSSASFGICLPSSFFFPKVRAFVPQPLAYKQSSKMFFFVCHYSHSKLMSGSEWQQLRALEKKLQTSTTVSFSDREARTDLLLPIAKWN